MNFTSSPGPIEPADGVTSYQSASRFLRTANAVRLPSLAPYLVSACKTGLGFAWKSGIAAEVICRPAGSVGNSLYRAKLLLETPEMFAWTATVVVLSVILEKLLVLAADRLQARHPQKEVAK